MVETKTAKPTERQYLPQYSNVANAPQEAPSIIEVPPDGVTQPPGIYAYDETEGEYVFVQGDVDVVNSGNLSDLNIDASRDWGGYDLTNIGVMNAERASIERASITQVAGRISQDSTSQSIPSGTLTTVEFDTVNLEHSDVVTADLTNDRLEINEAGIYQLKSAITFVADDGWSTGDIMQLRINVNGNNVERVRDARVGTAPQTINPAVHTLEASEGDTVDVSVYQNSGSAMDLDTDSDRSNLEVVRVG